MRLFPLLLPGLVMVRLLAGEPLPAGEAVKLEFKLQPGMDLRYTLSGSTKTTNGGRAEEGSISGSTRTLVCEADTKTDSVLLGSLGSMTFESKGANARPDQTQKMVSAFRMDKNGKIVQRQAKEKKEGDPKRSFITSSMLRQLEGSSFLPFGLPGKAVKPGDKWDSDSRFLWLPTGGKASSTLTELRTVEGRRCAFINSKITPGKEAGVPLPGITCDEELIFDIERGLPLERKIKMELSFGRGGNKMEMGIKLDTSGTLPAAELASAVVRCKALDAVVDKLYAEETDKAIEDLQKQRLDEKDPEWQKGLDALLTMANQIKQIGSRSAEAFDQTPKIDEEKAFAAAGALAENGKFKEAADGYRAFAEKYPAHALTPQALMTAASIYDKNLNDKASAEQMNKALVALREKGAAKEGEKDPLELYKLASSYATAGEDQKAIDTYRKFVASGYKDAKMCVLAQHRLAGILEKQGKTKEAAEAYRAVEAIKCEDAYATQLKEKAKQKAAALGGK